MKKFSVPNFDIENFQISGISEKCVYHKNAHIKMRISLRYHKNASFGRGFVPDPTKERLNARSN